jgi:dihydrolipoamide dehydrogenase
LRTQIDVAIIGVGTAALAAASEIRKVTNRFILVSNGIYGTTCIRAGCMPSKIFIQAAQLFHKRWLMEDRGIQGAQYLRMDIPVLLNHVRTLRKHFLYYTLQRTEEYKDHIVEGRPWFLSPAEIKINDAVYVAKRVVLATGSSPIIPPACNQYTGTILTSDTLFEQETLPPALGVMGLSVLGTEMAQAFARLGIKIMASHDQDMIGGITDPRIHDYALSYLREEFEIRLQETQEQCLQTKGVDGFFVAQSRKANLEDMGLEACGIIERDNPVMDYDPQTMQVKDFPVFAAGDVKLGRSILNEAVDEGRIAGRNAAQETITAYKRRTLLQITYTEPTLAVLGKPWAELDENSVNIGEATFDNQGRARIIGEPHGMVHIYADKKSDMLVGAELFAPEGEHLAHMLAWLIDRNVTVKQALDLPFYHPSLEEGLRTALESVAA